jgi:hypothetical protein
MFIITSILTVFIFALTASRIESFFGKLAYCSKGICRGRQLKLKTLPFLYCIAKFCTVNVTNKIAAE